MTRLGLAGRSLRHYARTNAAVVAGVAVAAAVLLGALAVGDSLRATLRDLLLARLGRTDRVLAAPRFLGEDLADALHARTGRAVCPLIEQDGAVAHETSGRRAAGVKVYGVDERFWAFHGVAAPALGDRDAALSPALLAELAPEAGSTLLVRVEQPSDVPAASLFGRKEDRGRTLRLRAGPALRADAMGEFSLAAGQQAVRAVFVPLRLLQRTLLQPQRVNTLLVGEGAGDPWPAARDALTLEHLGVRVRALPAQDALSLESATGFVPDEVLRAGEAAAAETGLAASPVLTYLVNDLRLGGRSVPYSLVSALGPEALRAVGGSGRGLVLNDWTARELGATSGDRIDFEYYVWEEAGRLVTRQASMAVEAVVPLRGPADDRDLAPEYPGITDSPHLSDWDPPFPVDLSRVRPQDERYWEEHRTTPKAFVALADGQALWRHRLGAATSVRLRTAAGRDPAEARDAFGVALRRRLDPGVAGITLVAVRESGLRAAEGASDFGQYFLAFSVFLLVAALLLAGLFFRLGVEQRAREVGLLRAVGWSEGRVRRLLLVEGAALAGAGALLGVLGALGYASLVLLGLRTVWVDAVGLGALRLAVRPTTLAIGVVASVAAALASVRLALRALRHASPRQLLSGGGAPAAPPRTRRRALALATAAAVASIGLVVASARGLVPAAGAFFGAGFGLLAAALALTWHRLTVPRTDAPVRSVPGLGLRNAGWRPGRSLLVVALIAFGTFVVVAVGAFRHGAQPASADRHAGHGGYALVGESALPVLHDPATREGRDALDLQGDARLDGVAFTRFRLRPGDEASCLNLYRPQRPRLLGAPHAFVEEGRFAFAASLAETEAERANPWRLLERATSDGTVPAIADANSLEYVLHLKPGDVLEVDRGGSPPLRLRIVGALRDSLFQGELILSEERFLQAYPDDPGYRFFLLDVPAARDAADVSAALEGHLERLGLDLSSAPARLDRFHRVENAYLSTFQTLGALGLLLGTVGLGAVLLRNALERRRELALLRAVGYDRRALSTVVLAEHALLLGAGLLSGTAAALLAVAPAAMARGAAAPLVAIALLVGAVAAAGLLASLVAGALLQRQELLPALRSE